MCGGEPFSLKEKLYFLTCTCFLLLQMLLVTILVANVISNVTKIVINICNDEQQVEKNSFSFGSLLVIEVIPSFPHSLILYKSLLFCVCDFKKIGV
jgi:hypothetical protein